LSQTNHHRGVLNNFKLPSQGDVFFQDKPPDMFNVSLKPNLSAFTVLAMLTAALVSCKQSELSESNEKPEDNRFTKVVLTQGFDEPMEMALTNDGHVLIVERKGRTESIRYKNKPGKNSYHHSCEYKVCKQRRCRK
jgi:hypothetical protein